MKKAYLAVVLILTAFLLSGCGKDIPVSPYADIPKPACTITMADGAQMVFTLDPASAPNTVANFISLANSGFYDGMKIDYVYPTYFIKSGDPEGDGTGSVDYSIAGEFTENGFVYNNISHDRGVISMCRLEDDYNSAGSQFFIMQASRPEYNGLYAAFGRIDPYDYASLNTLDYICGCSLDKEYRPLLRQTIQSIRVDTKGYQYDLIKYGQEEEYYSEENHEQ